MPRQVVFAAGAVLLLAIAGCATSRMVASRYERANVATDQPIIVYALGDRVYRLTQHQLADSAIVGLGTMSQRGRTIVFEGAIPLREIVAIKTNSRSVVRTLATAGVTMLFCALLVEGTGESGGLTAKEIIRYVGPTGGGGSSCPYVYAWNGTEYELQAEPFGVAWGRALELTTFHLLPAARPEHGEVRLRLTNEREETHYVNSVQLYAIQLGAAPAAVLDEEGMAWPLWQPAAPATGRDRSGRDILPEVASADGRMWECDSSSMMLGSGYEDVLDLTFVRPPLASTATLVLTGINTYLSTALYDYVCGVAGDQTPVLVHAIETDPELIARFRSYVHDASLQASVWDGHAWARAGEFRPEANAVTFTRALRIAVPAGVGDTVRVRLRSMADAWRIDAISADWSDASPLPMVPLEARSAIGPAGEDLVEVLGFDDDRYAILFPPDRVDLAFAAPRTSGARVTYAVASRGYLLEWERPAQEGRAPLAASAPAATSVELLKELMKHRELALQPVYESWRRVRGR